MRRRQNARFSLVLLSAFEELAEVLVIDFDAPAHGGISFGAKLAAGGSTVGRTHIMLQFDCNR